MSNVTAGTNWSAVDWRKVNKNVTNLRQRIYRAAKQGDLKKVRSLQRLMLRSYSNRLQAVRRVTQINAGKKPPGVDKLTIKTPEARGAFADALKKYEVWKALPVRRVYIPKANGKKRPLGIPVMTDRAIQAMVKSALEPYWETKFEGSSYGFRPGRGCHDAIEAIYNSVKGDALGELHLVNSGTPQGGVISPLLANVALHGMEEALSIKWRYRRGRDVFELQSRRALVRYADDFVVFTETEEDAEECRRILTGWLAERGLQFSEEKTQTVSLKDGFNFLGFNVRRYEVKDRRSNLKLLMKPSRESVQQYRDNLKAAWKKVLGHDTGRVIKVLNPQIRGWGNYFRVGVAAEVFNSLDHWMYRRCLRWAKRTHPTKSLKWDSTQILQGWVRTRQSVMAAA